MTIATNPIQKALEQDLVIVRAFDAPRDLVWKAWTEPREMAKWWGPHGFTNPLVELDARAGGALRIDMKGPQGPAMPCYGEFKEVAAPEKLVFTTKAFKKEDGHFGLETLVTALFAEDKGKTKLTLTVKLVHADPELTGPISGMKAGWNQSLDRLLALATESPEFVITHVVDAPRELAWKMYSDPAHLEKWWGPKDFPVRKLTLDFRPGGVMHYGLGAPGGDPVMWGKFTYTEIDAPERLAFIVSFSDENGGITRHPASASWPLETLSIVTFFEIAPGKTALIMSSVPVNASEEEKKVFGEGRASMEEGFKGTLQQLSAYLAEVRK